MSVAEPASISAPAAPAEILLENAGMRFDFDRRGRLVTPALRPVRRIRQTAWGLRGIDLAIPPGTGLALVGPTGSGKTTLLRVLAGVLAPDEGRCTVRGRVGSLLATEVGLQAMLTGREAAEALTVLSGLSLAAARSELEAIKERTSLGDAFERPVYTYSQGMRARLHLGVIQASSPQVLLLDEVFEALDHRYRKIVEDYATEIRNRGGIVVVAGHDHVALERLCSQAAWLSSGRLQMVGSAPEVIAAYRRA